MKSDNLIIWAETHSPKNLDEYIFHDASHKRAFEQMVQAGGLPHLLLSGVQGSGKTTIAQILINELHVEPADVLVINASDENSVDVMRDKIKSFINTMPFGKFKVVLLEEADHLSLAAQAILRKYTEDPTSSARFIFTCNYEHRIIAPLKSRLQQFRFKASDKDGIAELVAKILIQEKVKFNIDLLDKYVAIAYPDIRKIITLCQQNTYKGVLQDPTQESEAGDYKFKLLDLIATDDWIQARTLACANVATEEWEDLYRFLYENLDKSAKFNNKDKWEAGIVVIADHLYKNAIIADQEINAAAMFIRLSQI